MARTRDTDTTHDPDPRRRRARLITLASIGVILVILTGVGIYGLIIGEPGTTSTPTAPGEDNGNGASTGPSTPASQVPRLPRTTDPEQFATAVANSLFTWDTYTLLRPRDYRDALLQVADPSGEETPGLVADLDRYLPDDATWTKLQEYQTRQWLQIDRIYVPGQWADAESAGGDAIAEGTVAYTVEGVRHREGVWYDDPVTSSHQVAFTIFIACQPAFDQCALLRLSVLDQPLR